MNSVNMKLNYKRTVCVGFAFFLICAFWQAYDTIIPKILTDKFGMSQSLSGLIMAADNILALFLLPVFGSLSDKRSTRIGRRTPYILIGTILSAILFVSLSFADAMQLSNLTAGNDTILPETIYNTLEGRELKTPDGEIFTLSESGENSISLEEFSSIAASVDDSDYGTYYVSARQSYARAVTLENPFTIIFFIILLLILLISMSSFRSPAVALMPDITPKPLRSKGNAIINLMGAFGGIIVLALGVVFGTGKAENAVMSYVGFFAVIAGIMIVSLCIFMLTVRENKWADESGNSGVPEKAEEELLSGDHKLSKGELSSLLFILASVVFWYMGYNAVTSKYSVYSGKVLGIDYNLTLMIANAAAILSYLPIGAVSSKIGRKKTILCGVALLTASFTIASFARAGSPAVVMNLLFVLAGIGWAAINVNSYPMVVELATGSDVGKYTGFYYTASMAAQAFTPVFSGFFMDIKFTLLFPYAAVFVALSFVTMLFVRHGDVKL